MRKKLLVFIICGFTLLTACSQTKNSLGEAASKLEADKAALSESLSNQENEKEKLSRSITELEKQMDATERKRCFSRD